MKILQINNYNYLKGGSEKVYQVSIELLKSKGHDVQYFSIANEKNEEICPGYSVEVKPWSDAKGIIGKVKAVKNFVYNKEVAVELDLYLDRFKPDVVHLHIFYGGLSNAIVDVLVKHKIPIVQSVHEFRLLCPAYTCIDSNLEICEQCADTMFKSSCIKKRCVKGNLATSLVAAAECWVRDTFFNYQKNFSAFIMVSQFIRDKHIEYYPQIESKCFQIYNSVDVAHYNQFLVSANQKNDYYLYLGRLSYEKGIGTLINVFVRNPNLKLKIAGTGPAEEDLRRKVDLFGVNNIEFLGFVSGENLYRIIAQARYTMVPSEWYENNPLSIIESLALGTPIIGSRIGGIPELIEDGKNGFLHEPKNEVSLSEALFKAEHLTPEVYERQCQHSSKMAQQKFDNEIYYQKLITLYNNITDGQ